VREEASAKARPLPFFMLNGRGQTKHGGAVDLRTPLTHGKEAPPKSASFVAITSRRSRNHTGSIATTAKLPNDLSETAQRTRLRGVTSGRPRHAIRLSDGRF
jgi:hypothetical protein